MKMFSESSFSSFPILIGRKYLTHINIEDLLIVWRVLLVIVERINNRSIQLSCHYRARSWWTLCGVDHFWEWNRRLVGPMQKYFYCPPNPTSSHSPQRHPQKSKSLCSRIVTSTTQKKIKKSWSLNTMLHLLLLPLLLLMWCGQACKSKIAEYLALWIHTGWK